MAPRTPHIELHQDQLLGFDRLEPGAATDGRLADPRAAMVGVPKDPAPQPDAPDDSGDGLQSVTARVLADPRTAEALCGELVARIRAEVGEIDLVVAPAIGGIVAGYEVARQLGARFACFERTEDGFTLRGGPEILPDSRCAVVDDTVCYGRAMQGCIGAARDAGADVVVGGCLVADARHEAEVDVPLVFLEDNGEALALRAGERDAA